MPIIPLPKDDNSQTLQQTYTSVGNGRKTVAVHGTAVQLVSTSTACKRLDITAFQTNTKTIAVGSSSVLANPGTEQGVVLQPTETYTLFVTDLSFIWIDSEINGEGVSYTYFN